MEALFLLIPLSLLVLLIAALVFLKMNKSGQFDDSKTPAVSILLDDDSPKFDPDQK
jgi:cbb3-type cytochrome oxidase maturation protein